MSFRFPFLTFRSCPYTDREVRNARGEDDEQGSGDDPARRCARRSGSSPGTGSISGSPRVRAEIKRQASLADLSGHRAGAGQRSAARAGTRSGHWRCGGARRIGKRRRAGLLIDTNVLIRLLTQDPPDQAARAEALVAAADPDSLILTEMILAECAYVLESAYRLPRDEVAVKLLEAINARARSGSPIRSCSRRRSRSTLGTGSTSPTPTSARLTSSATQGRCSRSTVASTKSPGVERAAP